MRNDNWTTPPNLFQYLDRIFEFNLDGAASSRNTHCRLFIDKKQNTLKTRFNKKNRVYCNPPYSMAKEFCEHFYCQWSFHQTNSVLLIPVRSDRNWWNNFMEDPNVRHSFFTGRIHFGGSNGGAFMYNMLFIFGFEDVACIPSRIDAGQFNKNLRGSAQS